MGFDAEIRRIAVQKIEERRRLAEARAQMRKNAFYAKEPRAKELDSAIAGAAYSVFSNILIGNVAKENAEAELYKSRSELIRQRDMLYKKHGITHEDLLPKYQCRFCEDTGFIEGIQCKCLKNQMILTAAELANLPDDPSAVFKNFDLSYYSDVPKENGEPSPREYAKIAYDVCKQFARDFQKTKKNLYIYGDAGLGKTFLSFCIAHEVLKKGNSVLYQSAGALFKLLTDAAFGRELSDKDAYIIERAHHADLLIIDDLGTEFGNDYSKTAFFQLLNERMISGQSTIINSNIDIGQISALYTDRIFSRLTGAYATVNLKGTDIRQIQKKKVQEGIL